VTAQEQRDQLDEDNARLHSELASERSRREQEQERAGSGSGSGPDSPSSSLDTDSVTTSTKSPLERENEVLCTRLEQAVGEQQVLKDSAKALDLRCQELGEERDRLAIELREQAQRSLILRLRCFSISH
jgi:hypothetical protein